VGLEEDKVLQMVQERLDSNEDPLKILDDSRTAMSEIGYCFSSGQYYIPELVFAGEIMQEISSLVKLVLTKGPEVEHTGKVVFGTVAGDIHDIGKNIVVFMLESHGFEVIDLGADFDPDMTQGPLLSLPSKVMEALDLKWFRWPGHGIEEDKIY
jgi:5-methyltetrahydrofolate--homocysteine methyltransferase